MSEQQPNEIIPSVPDLDIGRIQQALDTVQPVEPNFIHVCGASASGKSTVSRVLARSISDTSVFQMDAYLSERLWDQSRQFNHESPDPNRPYIAGISPEIWDMDPMQAHLESLKRGEAVQMPIFDETLKDRVGYGGFEPSTNIVVEGGHAFSERFLPLASYAILVQAPLHDRLTRKIVRTHAIYGLDDVDEVLHRYLTKDEPIRRFYEPEFTELADQIVDNPSDPRRDYARLAGRSTEQSSDYYPLVPQLETGTLKAGEALGVVRNLGSLCISYAVDDRLLVRLPIEEETYDLLMRHYEVGERHDNAR